MTSRLAVTFGALAVASACRVAARPSPSSSRDGERQGPVLAVSNASGRTPLTAPPTTKDALRYLFANASTPLARDPSCGGVGTTLTDSTIGDFLSGFLAEYADSSAKNWLTVSWDSVTAHGVPAWKATVLLRRRTPDEVWAWGVGFVVRASDRAFVSESVRCLGSG